MKRLPIACAAAVLLSVSFSVQADVPDPTPGATKPVREQNLDVNEWIAVHEQGTADVNVTGGQIDANVTGGSIEAEITGGEIEVTNEVTVKFPEDEIIEVDVVSNEYRNIPTQFSIWIDPGDGFGLRVMNTESEFHIESSSCVAESAYLGINDSIYIAFYNENDRYDSVESIKFFPFADVCIPFTTGYDTGSLDSKYEYICKSNAPWTAKLKWLYAVIGGNGNTPVDKVVCTFNGYSFHW